MRFLAYLLTLFLVGTAVAQNPTILQGNYITNVFGNSNFVLNPNAQTNVANVTVSSATVTRSTTTPLVATSEFNITTSTATGSATWSTRTFDGGMKGQNCEARFTYRGFSVGSTTAQILQGANVVAQLTLTASTDPRIASINFPCGDLSAATTFRLQQATASLTGTNEIGGIYVGLATNMANVAQAELVGTWKMSGISSCLFTTSATTYGTPSNYSTAVSACNTPTVTGDIVGIGKVPGFNINVKPGKYLIVANSPFLRSAFATGAFISITDGTSRSEDFMNYLGSATDLVGATSINTVFEYSSAGTKTIYLDGKVDAAGAAAQLQNYGGRAITFYVYRFPSSSELVVKPETQNVFASVKATSAGANSNGVSSASWTKLTSSSTLTRTTFGKAKIESNNDYSITIENMPVGNYYVSSTGIYYSIAAVSGSAQDCYFALADSATGGAQIASLQATATADATKTDQIAINSTLGGVYTNTSVGTRTFYVQAYRPSGSGSCNAYTDTNRPFTITVIPLDQPSNSALYVQGPVLGAQTGAAIPSGYAGQVIHAIQSTNQTMASNAFTEISGLSATLTTGIWMVQGTAYWNRNGAAMSAFEIACALGGSSADVNANYGATKFYRIRTAQEIATPSQIIASSTSIRPFYVRSDGTNLYFADGTTFISGSQTIKMVCYTGTWTGGPLQASGVIEAVRIN